MTPRQHQSSNNDLAGTLANLEARLDAIDEKLTPISDAYKAATLGARVLKWSVTLLAAVAALWAFGTGKAHL